MNGAVEVHQQGAAGANQEGGEMGEGPMPMMAHVNTLSTKMRWWGMCNWGKWGTCNWGRWGRDNQEM